MSGFIDEKQIERQWYILQLVNRKNGITKQELKKELKVSERTIERDLGDLKWIFHVVEEKEGKQKRFKLSESCEFSNIQLSAMESFALILAKDLVSFYEGTCYSDYFIRAIKKIQASLPEKTLDYFKKLQKIITFKLAPPKNFQEFASWIKLAESACSEQKVLKITYQTSKTGEIKTRKINPYGIYQQEGSLRLIAYCQAKNGTREFCFDGRMTSLEKLDESFIRDPNFDLNDYVLNGGFGGMKDEHVKAIIKIDPPVSRWVRETNLPGLKKMVELGNDVIEMHFDTKGKEGLMRWVLECGKCAEVVSPLDFRKEIMEEIKKTLKKYD